jgi:putative transposase
MAPRYGRGELHEACLANAIFAAPLPRPEFGYRFVADEVRLAGIDITDRAAWRLFLHFPLVG